MPESIKRPGEFWWACHPWFSRARFLCSSGHDITIKSLQQENARYVRMEIKPHPVLILGPGDESLNGYLVCYLSSRKKADDPIKRRSIGTIAVTHERKEAFVFSMAPCYCNDEFIWTRIRTAEPPVMDLVRGVLKWACRLASEQRWDCFTFEDIAPTLAMENLEPIRAALRDVFDAFRHYAQPPPIDHDQTTAEHLSPDDVLDATESPPTSP